MKTIRAFLAVLIAAGPAASAAGTGGRPGEFLDYAASARSLAMGHAYTAIASDPSAVYWNPSGVALLPQKSLAAQFSTLMDDAKYGFVGYAQPFRERAGLGVAFVNLQSGTIARRDATGAKTGNYDASSQGLLLSGSYRATSALSFGSTLKFVRESVADTAGMGGGLDLGSLYRLSPQWQVGLMLRNLVAPSVKLDREADSYPHAVVAGLGFSPIRPLTLGLDLEKSQGTSARARFGADYNFNNLLSLRAGVNDAEFTAGLGVGLGAWSLDYAMGYARGSSEVREFGSFQRIGVQFNFGAVQPPFTPRAAPPVPVKAKAAPVAVPAAKAKPAPVKKETAAPAAAVAATKTPKDRNQPYVDELNALGKKMDTWDGVPTREIQDMVGDVNRSLRKGRFVKPADIYAAQGYVSYFTGEYARSVRSLENALKADPNNKEIASRLKRAQDVVLRPAASAGTSSAAPRKNETPEIRAVREKYERGDYANTILLAQRVLEASPKDPEASSYLRKSLDHIIQPYLRQGKAMLDGDRFVESFVHFQKALDYDPDNAEAKGYAERLVRIIEKKSDLDYLAKGTAKSDPEVAQGIAQYQKGLRLYGHGDLAAARAAWQSALPNLKGNQVLYDAVRSTVADLSN